MTFTENTLEEKKILIDCFESLEPFFKKYHFVNFSCCHRCKNNMYFFVPRVLAG